MQFPAQILAGPGVVMLQAGLFIMADEPFQGSSLMKLAYAFLHTEIDHVSGWASVARLSAIHFRG